MRRSGRHFKAAAVLWLTCLLGCAVPSGATPPLSVTAAQRTLDSWNPAYCKVVEFYGFFQPGGNPGSARIAYVLLTNPSDKAQKQGVYAAQFQLLTLPDGQQQWFLTSLLTHGAGLTRRQGWDNLIILVKDAVPAAARQ